nr:acyltransferase family protein [Pseudorhodoferax sp. Leaf265]
MEEQFYVIFPLLFYAWFRHRGGHGAKAWTARVLLPALLLASFAYCAYETSKRPDLAYYMLPSRFWELACGALLFRLHHAGRALPATAGRAGMWTIAGSLLIALAFVYADKRTFPFPWAVPAVLGAVLVIGGSVGDVARRAWPNALLGSRVVTYIGKISYSLYLWHWPVLVVLRWTTGLDDARVLVFAAVLAFGLAAASYHGVEQGRWWRQRLSGWPSRRTVVYGSACLVLGAVCFAGILASQRWISLSVTRDARVWQPNAWPSAGVTTPVDGGPLVGRKLFVLGDSHAGAYRTMLQQLKERTGVEVSTFSRGGCAAAGLRYSANQACKDWVAAKIAEIKQKAAPGDICACGAWRTSGRSSSQSPRPPTVLHHVMFGRPWSSRRPTRSWPRSRRPACRWSSTRPNRSSNRLPSVVRIGSTRAIRSARAASSSSAIFSSSAASRSWMRWRSSRLCILHWRSGTPSRCCARRRSALPLTDRCRSSSMGTI